jgi:uncharacterized protein (DUF1501 family)
MSKLNKKSDAGVSRRDFMRQSGCAALGVTGMVNSLSHLLLTQSALAQTGGLQDYKALVVIFLFGGNDANNMLIPSATHPSRPDYDSGRGVLAIPPSQLHLLDYPSAIDQQYGLHPNLQPVADLFNSGDLAFLANIGTLVEPVPDRDAFLNQTVSIPPQLFSHSDQQLQWQSSIPDQPFTSGWGGRTADLLNPLYNSNGNISMSISLAGINRLQVGSNVIQYVVSPNGITEFADAGYGSNYGNALNPDGTYKNNNAGRRLQAFDTVMNYAHAHLLEDGHRQVVQRALEVEGFVGTALDDAANSGVDFNALFMNAQNSLGDQLKMIAQLIAGRNALANERQIYFCSVGGYDNHAAQLPAHANLLTELGSSLKAFSDTMKALAVDDKVVTMTHSDFARTFTPNKEDPLTAGSDHAWGAHQIAMGGPVNGGSLYGFYPSLKLNADLDAGVNGRGRWIPTTSVEQYQAVATSWLGVNSNELNAIFPNLYRFEDPFGPLANLGYLNLT